MQPGQRAGIPTLLVLQNRDFRSLWTSGSLVEGARRLEIFTLSWFILVTTNSPFQLGLPWVFFHAPMPLFGLFSGVIADRFSRHKVLVSAQIINAFTALAILLLIVGDLIQPWHVYIASFVSGTTRALDQPSRRGAILDIVGARRLINAMSLEAIGRTVGKMGGVLLAGGLISLSGIGAAYVCGLAVHLLTLWLLMGVTIPRSSRIPSAESVWSSLREAIRYVQRRPMLLGMLYATVVMNLLVLPYTQFIPAIGRIHLGAGAGLVGLLASADAIGVFAAAGALAAVRDIQYHGRWFVGACLTIILVAILFAWSPWYAFAVVVLVGMGIGQGLFMSVQSPIMMLWSPPEMRGRMLGLMGICIGAGIPLGTLAIGGMASALDTRWAIFISALTGLVLYLPAIIFTPLVRERLEDQPRQDGDRVGG